MVALTKRMGVFKTNKLMFAVLFMAIGTVFAASGWTSLSERLPAVLEGQITGTDMRDMVLIAAGLVILLVAVAAALRGNLVRFKETATISGAPVKDRTDAWLRRNGFVLDAHIVGIMPTVGHSGGRKLGWQVTARAFGPQRQKIYTFRSDPLDFDPDGSIAPGDPIPVLIDPDNPKQYWVDISGIKPARLNPAA